MPKTMILALAAIVAISASSEAAKPPKTKPANLPRVFIKGNNIGAREARQRAAKSKCFQLANRESEADAILDVQSTAHRGTQNILTPYDATAILTKPDGTQIWEESSQLGGSMIARRLDRALCESNKKR